MSGAEKKNKIPEAPTPVPLPGNLLSSVAPPTELPNFVMAAPIVPSPSTVELVPNVVPPASVCVPVPPIQPVLIQHKLEGQPQSPEHFSPVIPLSKGEPMLPIRSPDDSQTTQSPELLSDTTTEQLGDVMPGSGLITWMKGAISTGGILQRVAEKAKSSVDTMITTLDPQMKEYLKSGGDLYIVVASDKEVKIAPVREAFQTVFGQATIVGQPAQGSVTAQQPVGCAAAYAAAKQRIAHVRAHHAALTNNVPVVAVESYLHEAICDRWYDIALMVLSQPSLGIELQVQSQGTPVPAAAVSAASAATPEDYPHRQTGYKVTVGSIMAANLNVPHTHWHEESTGVSRRELLVLAARSLAGSYKKLLAVSAAQL